MRTLGDARWLNHYVGLPYTPGGRDPRGLDCYGLVKLVYLEQYGEVLPDWSTDALDIKGRADAIGAVVCSGDWFELDEPVDGCLAVCSRVRAPHHIGVCFAGGVLHALEGTGTVFEPMARFRERFTKVVFGEWTP